MIAFEAAPDSRQLRVLEETFAEDGQPVFTRKGGQLLFATAPHGHASGVAMGQHLALLPVLQDGAGPGPLSAFRQWLSRMLILRPIPALINGESTEETLYPDPKCVNLGAWFSGLVLQTPRAYIDIDAFLKQVMPDFSGIENQSVGKDARNLVIQFSQNQATLELPVARLSDGEKCFLISALALATSKWLGPLFCFWDEPDNYLAMDEVGHFVMDLRRAFNAGGGQFITTSHNPEAIRRFSDENTLLLYRKNHMEPVTVRPLSEIQVNGDLINAMIRGDVEP
ncbi:MAG: ATP-binding protein [Blastocatellia bacterium]